MTVEISTSRQWKIPAARAASELVAENILAVRHWVEHVVPQVPAEQDYLLGLANEAESAPPATEGQQVFMVAIRAADPGEAFGEITALAEGFHRE